MKPVRPSVFIVFIVAMLLLAISLTFSASITYTQDGAPILTNGTNTTAPSNLNADDINYYNITAATILGTTTQMLVNANFSTNDSNWTKVVGGASTIAWYNSGQTGGSENVTLTGANKNNDNDIIQNVTAGSKPSSGTIKWCYSVTRWSGGTSSNLSVYLRSPGGSGFGTLLDNTSITGTTAWTCRNASVPSAVLNSSGTYQFTARSHLQTTAGGTKFISVLWDDFELNFTGPTTYKLNVTHISTATVAVPANYTLKNVTALIKLKSNSTAAGYTPYWYYNGAYTNASCNATTTIGSSDVNLTCSDESNPSLAISGSTIRIQLSTNVSTVPFLTSENFILYRIRFPNVTAATISPASNSSPLTGTAFNVSCSASADSDFAVTGVDFNLQWRNVTSGEAFKLMNTSAGGGLYLNASTSTNPYTTVSIPAGGSNTTNWTVIANIAGSYEIRCFVNSTTGGNMVSNATGISVIAVSVYNFTVSPAVDNFSVVNNTYIDRNFTLSNTGNQQLNISCSTNVSWASNITACPTNLAAGSAANVTFRFNATGRSAGNEFVFLNFTNQNVSKNATANVTITALSVYNFTVSPAVDNFSVANSTYADRNYTVSNTGNQVLNIGCSSNVTWSTNITACPTNLASGNSADVTFRFNATGRPAAVELVFLNFTDPNVSGNATANVTITSAAQPTINLTLVKPNASTTTDPFTPFNQTCNASCTGGQCDTVDIFSQFSSDGGSIYADMNTTTALNTSTAQPQSCGNIPSGSSCEKIWNVTGKTPGTYKIRCRSTSTNAAAATSATPSFDIIPNAFVETSISPGTISFGSKDPGTNDSAASENPIVLTVTGNTNVNVDTYLQASALTGAGTIGIPNLKVSKTVGGAKTALVSSPNFLSGAGPNQGYYENTAPLGTQNYYFWLTIPSGQTAGSYTGTITFKTVQDGTAA